MKKTFHLLITFIVIALLFLLSPDSIKSQFKVFYSQITGSDLKSEYKDNIRKENSKILKENQNFNLLSLKEKSLRIRCDSMYINEIGFKDGIVYTLDTKYNNETKEIIGVAYSDDSNSKYFYDAKSNYYSWSKSNIDFQYFVDEMKLYYKEDGKVVERGCEPI